MGNKSTSSPWQIPFSLLHVLPLVLLGQKEVMAMGVCGRGGSSLHGEQQHGTAAGKEQGKIESQRSPQWLTSSSFHFPPPHPLLTVYQNAKATNGLKHSLGQSIMICFRTRCVLLILWTSLNPVKLITNVNRHTVHVQTFVWTYVFCFFDQTTRVHLLDYIVKVYLVSEEITSVFQHGCCILHSHHQGRRVPALFICASICSQYSGFEHSNSGVVSKLWSQITKKKVHEL